MIKEKNDQLRMCIKQDKAQEFDEFFSNEYQYLKSFSKSIDPKEDYEGLLHDVYGRCKDRILRAGFSGHSFLNFTRVSLMNQYKSNYRVKHKHQHIDILDENYYHNIEQNLEIKRQAEEDEQERDQQISYINTMIYQYVSENYDEKHQFVFKTYFLLKPKRINYKQLAEATGVPISTVSKIIKKMKIEIKDNLEDFINGRTITSGCTVSIGN